MKRFVGARALVAASLLALLCFAIPAAGAGAAAPTGTRVLAPKPLIPPGAKALGAVSPTATVSGAVVLQPRDPDALTLCEYVHGTDVHGTMPAFRRPGDGTPPAVLPSTSCPVCAARRVADFPSTAAAHLPKPFALNKLTACVRKLLDSGSQ